MKRQKIQETGGKTGQRINQRSFGDQNWYLENVSGDSNKTGILSNVFARDPGRKESGKLPEKIHTDLLN